MDRPCLGAYTEPAVHEAISHIIRRYSTNRSDVRHEALQGIDLTGVARLLDLGCGFGFMVDALADALPPDSEIVGVDVHPTNREVFLTRAEAAAGSARFVCRRLDSHLDFPRRSFDAVIASYSLYYFPGVIPEVARVLKPDGLFLSLTHSESQFECLLEAIGFAPRQSEFRSVLLEFSAENGGAKLAEHFATVESRPYHNRLVFCPEDLDDFLALLRFKLPSLIPAQTFDPDRATQLLERARDLLMSSDHVIIEKDDTVFISKEPLSL
ncbi:MAG: class I SAM-dependent methyltransferase [Actinomycetota bacterium]